MKKETLVWLGSGTLSARALEGCPDVDGLELLDWLSARRAVTPQQASRLRDLWRQGWPARQLEDCTESGVTVVTCRDSQYPERLWDCAEPPMVLYCRGPVVQSGVAVVGTRRCSAYGAHVAQWVGRGLSEAGVTVVSGGAAGVDGASHSGALDGGTPTAAVLGTGVDVVWPRGHEELFSRIIGSGGSLISEYPLGAAGKPWHFPRRNRIVAALATSVVVVESPIRGGAMITARLAMEMGRDLWAVPGRIDEDTCAGSNRLLYDGATPLVDRPSFLQSVTGLGQLNLFDADGESGLSDVQRSVLEAVRSSGDKSADQISIDSGVPPYQVPGVLSALQVKGLIYPSGVGRWRAAMQGGKR